MTKSTRVVHALLTELWAIEGAWPHILVKIAQRGHSSPDIQDAREWVKRDHLAMAGGGAQKLPGAHRGFVVGSIGVLPITGPIFPRANMLTEMSGATSLAMLTNDYQVMLASRDVRSVMLLIDSPGGAVSGVGAFVQMVERGDRQKPTHSYVTGAAASAAYWIASATSRVSVDRSAMLGSIGVVAMVPKQVAPDEQGDMTIEIVSSNAPNKRPDPQADDGAGVIRASLDHIEALFVGDVARGRKVPASKVVNEFGRGGILVGSAAVKVGMADAVETQAHAMSVLRHTALMGRPTVASATSSADQEDLNRLRVAALRR